MPDILQILSRYWKTIALITLFATAISYVLLLIQSKQYLSVATALPASSISADKARIFNNNIEQLYSNFGNTNDLDRILGTTELDTLYKTVVKEHNLVDYYKTDKSTDPALMAASELRKNASIAKSGFGELKIKVWDEDNKKAALLANSLLRNLESIHQQLQNKSNEIVLENIKKDYETIKQQFQFDSLNASGDNDALLTIRKNTQLEQLRQYEKLMAEYNLVLRTNPNILLVVEHATPSIKTDRPKIFQTLLLVFFAAAAFSFLSILFLESRRSAK